MTLALMLNLVIASMLSALLYIFLKFFQRFGIYNLHGLMFNYITAASFAFFCDYQHNVSILPASVSFAPYALGIGLLFIMVFYTAAITAQKSGIAITSIAGKMSMVVPIIAGFILYDDQITGLRIGGMILALVAVYLSSASKKINEDEKSHHINWLYPLLLFIGSGLVDTSIKISQYYFIRPENENLFFCFLFGSAGTFGIIATLYLYITKKIKVKLVSLIGGVILGIANYYSLVFLVRCLAAPGAESALIFAMTNMLVVVFSALAGYFIFSEKLTSSKLVGIGIALIAIFILTA